MTVDVVVLMNDDTSELEIKKINHTFSSICNKIYNNYYTILKYVKCK